MLSRALVIVLFRLGLELELEHEVALELKLKHESDLCSRFNLFVISRSTDAAAFTLLGGLWTLSSRKGSRKAGSFSTGSRYQLLLSIKTNECNSGSWVRA